MPRFSHFYLKRIYSSIKKDIRVNHKNVRKNQKLSVKEKNIKNLKEIPKDAVYDATQIVFYGLFGLSVLVSGGITATGSILHLQGMEAKDVGDMIRRNCLISAKNVEDGNYHCLLLGPFAHLHPLHLVGNLMLISFLWRSRFPVKRAFDVYFLTSVYLFGGAYAIADFQKHSEYYKYESDDHSVTGSGLSITLFALMTHYFIKKPHAFVTIRGFNVVMLPFAIFILYLPHIYEFIKCYTAKEDELEEFKKTYLGSYGHIVGMCLGVVSAILF